MISKEALKQKIKLYAPNFCYRIYVKYRINQARKINRNKSVEEVFRTTYSRNIWGGDKGTFYSGSGSSDKYIYQYVSEIRKLIKEKNIKTIIDLGCGDFRVGEKIVSDDISYIGVDILDELIENNQRCFTKKNIKFLASDIINDPLPDADLCLIRQVFQHLSNNEILSILDKVRKYKYIIVTEHYPSYKIKKVKINKDKPHGPDIRVYDNSAVFLDRSPFNCNVKRVLLEVETDDYIVMKGEKIISFLI